MPSLPLLDIFRITSVLHLLAPHCTFIMNWEKMDKYRLVEEKFIGAQGFIDHDERYKGDSQGDIILEGDVQCTVRITQQAKPRSCITTAMNILVRSSASVSFDIFFLLHLGSLHSTVRKLIILRTAQFYSPNRKVEKKL